jgi:uncharacterized protein YecE (DUF72 family)
MEWNIGTSGFMINKDTWLNDTNLNCLEINYTFYRLPKPETILKWKEYKNINFAIKAPKKITHIKRLNDVKKYWKLFWSIIKVLDKKLSVILFQLPPSFKFNSVNIERLEIMSEYLPKKKVNIVFEFRDISWFTSKVYKLMKTKKWCMAGTVINKKEGDETWMGTMPHGILLPPKTSDITYLRVHGSKKYKGAYNKRELGKMIKGIMKNKTNTNFVLFNNTFFTDRSKYCIKNDKKIKSAAVCNAIEMNDILRS